MSNDVAVWHGGKPYDGKGGEWKPAVNAILAAEPINALPQDLIASTGVVGVSATGVDCTTNNCTNYPANTRGCAICALVEVRIPKGAQINAVEFGSTADYPNDSGFPKLMAPGKIERGLTMMAGAAMIALREQRASTLLITTDQVTALAG